MDRLISIYKNLKNNSNINYTRNYIINTLKIVEELKLIVLQNEIVKDIEKKILNHLKIKEIKDMGFLTCSK